jgi:hypothetical protein
MDRARDRPLQGIAVVKYYYHGLAHMRHTQGYVLGQFILHLQHNQSYANIANGNVGESSWEDTRIQGTSLGMTVQQSNERG